MIFLFYWSHNYIFSDLPELKELHDKFLEICKSNSTKVLTVNENQASNFGGLIDVLLVPPKYGG